MLEVYFNWLLMTVVYFITENKWHLKSSNLNN